MRVSAGPLPRWRVLSDCSATACGSWDVTGHLSKGSLGYSLCLQRYASEPVAAGPFVFSAGGMRRRRLAPRLPTPEKEFVPKPDGAPPGPGDVEVLEGGFTQRRKVRKGRKEAGGAGPPILTAGARLFALVMAPANSWPRIGGHSLAVDPAERDRRSSRPSADGFLGAHAGVFVVA
jgi:hypothetical protein